VIVVPMLYCIYFKR